MHENETVEITRFYTKTSFNPEIKYSAGMGFYILRAIKMPPSFLLSKNYCVAKKSDARLNYFAFSTKRLCTICRCLSGILILPEEII